MDPSAQDERLPAHKRRSGRMESLHEFQQRALSYNQGDDKRHPDDHVFIELRSPANGLDHSVSRPQVTSRVVSDCSDDSGDMGLRRLVASRRSTTSLFGSADRTTKTVAKFYGHQAKVLCFLILLGVIGGPLSYSIRALYNRIARLRLYLITLTSSLPLQYLLWTSHTVAFTLLALLWTRLSPVAAGSGVSQMKSVLTGIDPRMYLPGYFDTATLFAKVGGLVCAVGAGLIVGTEGAFVHIMSIITHHLLQTPFFAGFSDRLNARLQLLAAACAVGVSSTFSSPIGGVLFSMEVTSTYYLISNYMKAFISSVSGSLMLQLTLTLADSSSAERGTSILQTSLPVQSFAMWEIPIFVIMGAFIGVLVTAMVSLLRYLAVRRRNLRAGTDSTWRRLIIEWMDPLVVAWITATLTFWPGEFVHDRSLSELAVLFTEGDLPPAWHSPQSRFIALASLCVVYMLLLPLCITLRVPTGVWLPTFIAGAAFGRLAGEALQCIAMFQSIVPGAYALAGAAAFAAAATRTVSAAVITLEITGSMPMMLPIFCAVLASIGVANLGSEQSVYDTLLVASGLPYLPLVDFDPRLVAGDIVEPLLVYVTKRTTVAKLLLAMQRMPDQDLPVVHNETDLRLLGLVSGTQVRQLVTFYYKMHNLPDVDIDLGDAVDPDAPLFSWMTLVSKFSAARADHANRDSGGHHGRRGGFYGRSYDQVYHALSTTLRCEDRTPGGVDGAPLPVHGPFATKTPFLMDDDKMIALLSERWSDNKRELLQASIKLSYGNLCVLKPMALTVSSATPLDDLHMMFTMLRCDHVYVCDQGALVGVVTTKTLLRAKMACETAET